MIVKMKQKNSMVLLALAACGVMEASSIYSLYKHIVFPETCNTFIEVMTCFMCVAPIVLGVWIYYTLVWKHRNDAEYDSGDN